MLSTGGALTERCAHTTPTEPFPCDARRQAKWALDVIVARGGLPYTTSPYPFSPFPAALLPLRLRIGKLRGRVTAPILLTSPGAPDNEIIMDSTAIARWADARIGGTAGKGGALFPPEHEHELERCGLSRGAQCASPPGGQRGGIGAQRNCTESGRVEPLAPMVPCGLIAGGPSLQLGVDNTLMTIIAS
jgi:hypothetical protein